MALRWIMLLVLFVVRLAMGYQFQSVASTASQLVDRFGFSYAQIGTLIGLFLLPGIVVAIPSGLLTRALADKTLLLIGAVAMIVGGLVMGFAETPAMLYVGRCITGVGGTIFNVILTKMITDWFLGKEIVTALAVMLTSWPIGIALGLLSQGWAADHYGWQGAMHATVAVAAFGFVLTALVYREAPNAGDGKAQALRISLPRRQFVHMCAAGIAWTCFNASLIAAVSFAPDVLVAHGYAPDAARASTSLLMWVTLFSLPFGGRLLELVGYITPAMLGSLTVSGLALGAIPTGLAPEAMLIAVGIFLGLPAGALMSLSAEAVTPDNRGPGLGIFYTIYYVGMTVFPAVAGWARDVTGAVGAPLYLAGGLMGVTLLSIVLFRLLQRAWPIQAATSA